jgi:hypothetical protein
MPGKKGHTYWHRQLDPLFGAWMREKYTECSMCHKEHYLQVSHILPKGRYQGLRYDPMNILPMCGFCHLSWHANPLESTKWFEAHYPQRAIYLREAQRILVKRDYEYYNRVKEALKEKNVRLLLTLEGKSLE